MATEEALIPRANSFMASRFTSHSSLDPSSDYLSLKELE